MLSSFIARIVGGRDKPQSAADWAPTEPDSGGWAELLSISPTIVHTFPLPELPLGAASVLGPMLRKRSVHFLLMFPWTLEDPGKRARLLAAAASYVRDHPKHRLIFLGNTTRETELMREEGWTATTINQNCLMNEEVFKPLPDIDPIYDAVYNARLDRWKRHDLAREIDKLALIYFRHVKSVEQFHAEHARLTAIMPNAHFVNKLTPEGCEWILGPAINRILAQSRVGLCLSAAEGAMRASIEYLMAGLPVVSTPSLGGRDVYFDEAFSIICPPEPRSVREATEALIARNVPRDFVRAKTLAKVDQQRRQYIDLVQDLIERAGGTLRFEERFIELTRGESIMRWGAMKQFSNTAYRLVRENPAEFSSAWSARYATSAAGNP